MRENMGVYRGKRKENGEWVEGFYFERKDTAGEIIGAYIIEDAYEQVMGGRQFIRSDLHTECYRVDPDTVGECTGEPDKNGKRIFEADILLLDDLKGFVNYGTGCFCVRMQHPDYLCRNNPAIDIVLNEYPRLEVIGNIHDNPELLEGAQK